MALAIAIILIATVGSANISEGLIKNPWLEINCNCKEHLNSCISGKCTRDPGPLVGPKTLDPEPIWKMGPSFQNQGH